MKYVRFGHTEKFEYKCRDKKFLAADHTWNTEHMPEKNHLNKVSKAITTQKTEWITKEKKSLNSANLMELQSTDKPPFGSHELQEEFQDIINTDKKLHSSLNDYHHD